MPVPPPATFEEVLRRLARHSAPESRYSESGLIAEGGMGAVHEARDVDLERAVAIKRIRERGVALDPQQLRRFLDEARITAQLTHPGVVPVHELGVDHAGRVYFSMALVRGRTLAETYALAREGREGWSRTRVLGVIQRVCETMAYAHSRGVIHRDLKPANVMVGAFGEVYVMDWGLAKLVGSEAQDGPPADSALPAREAEAGAGLTEEGTIVGTLSYMPPEQARGERIDERSDVYSVGAMLYTLLGGREPYSSPNVALAPARIIAAIHGGPPLALERIARDVPQELVAVCEKAMARDPGARYASMQELAGDLAAFLDRRVVKAYETGPLAELRKWVARNRGFAAVALLALLALVAGLFFRGRAQANELLAGVAFRTDGLDELVRRLDELWPLAPEVRQPLRDWLARVDEARAGRDGKPGFEELRRRAAELAEAKAGAAAPSSSVFARHMLEALDAIEDAEQGLVAGHSPVHGWGAERRLAMLDRLERETSLSAPARARWAEAIADIADAARNPHYRGLRIEPEFGLLPLGRNAAGCWEFADLATGTAPVAGIAPAEETGVVLVLLPGGSFFMGTQGSDPAAPNFDPYSNLNEQPVRRIELDPFLMSKYELTQAQWLRMTARNPSGYKPPGWTRLPITLAHPVEQVSWLDCQLWLARFGMQIPTEAQWEYALRAGGSSPWITGTEPRSLEGHANLADQDSRDFQRMPGWIYEDIHDGAPIHTGVGSYAANGFGIHDMLGNVQEWCRDLSGRYLEAVAPHDGLGSASMDSGLAEQEQSRSQRGGSYDAGAIEYARSGARAHASPRAAMANTGIRPARVLKGFRLP